MMQPVTEHCRWCSKVISTNKREAHERSPECKAAYRLRMDRWHDKRYPKSKRLPR